MESQAIEILSMSIWRRFQACFPEADKAERLHGRLIHFHVHDIPRLMSFFLHPGKYPITL